MLKPASDKKAGLDDSHLHDLRPADAAKRKKLFFPAALRARNEGHAEERVGRHWTARRHLRLVKPPPAWLPQPRLEQTKSLL